MTHQAESNLYTLRGVSSQKTEIHKAIEGSDAGLFPGAFCKILPDSLTGDQQSCLLMHSDGAGTKASLAYLYWKETGDLSVFKGIAVDSLVMNLDDLACVGAVDRFLLTNTIGRNRFFIPGEVIQAIIEGYAEIAEKLSGLGIEVELCGGETADVGDLVRTLIVDSSMIAKMKRKQILDLNAIQPGDLIVGFASYGQALWESEYNSGIGSNGLTGARHDCLHPEYRTKYPESFSPEMPEEMAYCGPGRLSDSLPGTQMTLGRALLSPTRTYAPLIKRLLDNLNEQIHGFVHCTGGGQTKCMKFGKGIHYHKNDLFKIPPLFDYIQKTRDYPLKDLFPVYNMGHRLEMFMLPEKAEEALAIAKELKIEAKIIGHCEKSETGQNRLTIEHDGTRIEY